MSHRPRQRQRREPARYSARAQKPDGTIQELGISADSLQMIRLAKNHHAEHGSNVWVWNVRTGETVFGIATAEMVQKAGAR